MFNNKLVESLSKSSMIRAMFEEGARLKKIYGDDKVYDFSLGNPEVEPPVQVLETLKNYVNRGEQGLHKYMNNAGFPDVRQKVAAYVQKNSGVQMNENNIVMVCGAAAGLNVTLKAILNPGEEVIVLAPFFVEYGTYIEHANGKTVVVNTKKDSFQIDVKAVEDAITEKTKAIIINSPNNPTGVIYSRESLESLNQAIERKEAELGISIFVISDEPYISLVYDGAEVPNILSIFKKSIQINSFSKSLALPGERIGYIAASSNIPEVGTLISAMVTLNRTLGFVNAPSLFQKVIADNLEVAVDTESYKKKRDLLYNHLTEIGFKCIKPDGAFYLFVKAPIEDDVAFCASAAKYNILIVPGTGFRGPGYVRIAYCVDIGMIERSLDAFAKLSKEYGLR
ncbi:MAG: pyridoxal phosphate-dependent aminotransferase [Acetivibrionales bacterium]|jgi:aspartate aminotransferase|nr:pyridoxal phosphate-dependent aminotransferase [Clostridiaceae bacterium]